jgi:hypothetical protein
MRTKIVKVNNKDICISEKKIKELRELSKEINIDFNSFIGTDVKDQKTDDIVTVVFEKVQEKLTVIFPTLTNEDIEEAYMSEIEELIGGFIEVNFTGMKKVFSQAMNMM